MYWQEKEFTYDIIISPIKKPFEKFTKKQAETYFNWHMSILRDRIEYLQFRSGVSLDYSLESLVNIWKWLREMVDIEETPPARIEELIQSTQHLPEPLAKRIIESQTRQFSLQTEYIIQDIARYFGDLLVHRHEELRWTYFTSRRGIENNWPTVDGFKVGEDYTFSYTPGRVVRMVALNIKDGTYKETDLLNYYNKIITYLPNGSGGAEYMAYMNSIDDRFKEARKHRNKPRSTDR